MQPISNRRRDSTADSVMASPTDRSPSGKADRGRSDVDRFSFTTSEYKGHAVPLRPMDGSGGGDNPQVNVYGEPLTPCSLAPKTGWFRSGCCETESRDTGSHTVCAVMTAEFLDFSRSRGNDLSTPQPAYGFPGLKPGDRWCLCAARWQEALQAGKAPKVLLKATHRRALELIALADLKAHAIDLV